MMNKLTEGVASIVPKFEIPTFEIPESAFAAMRAASGVQDIVNPLSEVNYRPAIQ